MVVEDFKSGGAAAEESETSSHTDPLNLSFGMQQVNQHIEVVESAARGELEAAAKAVEVAQQLLCCARHQEVQFIAHFVGHVCAAVSSKEAHDMQTLDMIASDLGIDRRFPTVRTDTDKALLQELLKLYRAHMGSERKERHARSCHFADELAQARKARNIARTRHRAVNATSQAPSSHDSTEMKISDCKSIRSKCVGANSVWEDPDFRPGASSIYITPGYRRSGAGNKSLPVDEWKRVEGLKMVASKYKPRDIEQGRFD